MENGKLKICYGEFYEEASVVGGVSLKSRLASAELSAFLTAVNDNKSFFGIGLGAYGTQSASAFVGSVTGVYVYVYRP